MPLDDAVLTAPGAIVGIDGSISPLITQLDSRVNVAAGLTWQHPGGMLLGVGMNYRVGIDGRSAVGLQLRLGFHSGVRIFQPHRHYLLLRVLSRQLPHEWRRHPSRRNRFRVRCPCRRPSTARPPFGRSAIPVALRLVSQ